MKFIWCRSPLFAMRNWSEAPANMSTRWRPKIYSSATAKQLKKLPIYSRCRVNTGKHKERWAQLKRLVGTKSRFRLKSARRMKISLATLWTSMSTESIWKSLQKKERNHFNHKFSLHCQNTLWEGNLCLTNSFCKWTQENGYDVDHLDMKNLNNLLSVFWNFIILVWPCPFALCCLHGEFIVCSGAPEKWCFIGCYRRGNWNSISFR